MSRPDPAPKSRLPIPVLVAVLLALVAGLTYPLWGAPSDTPKQVTFSEAVALIDDSQVASARIDDNDRTVTLTLDDSSAVKADFPVGYSETLAGQLVEADVPTEAAPVARTGLLTSVFMSLLPMLLIIALVVWLVKSKVFGGGLGLGRRGQAVGELPETRFADVAGCDEAVVDLREMVDLLLNPDKFAHVGAQTPKGALLVGPPGTGKTLLARAVAGEAGATFYALSASDFVEVFAGAGARRVRDLFDRAAQDEKAIIFIDELDAVGRSRSTGSGIGSDSEREQTLVSLLTALDGFTARSVLVLAATNRPDVLDEALTRPGRLDRTIVVSLPDRGGREDILRVHTRNRPLVGVDLQALARRTPGFSGAELERLVNEASLAAARAGSTAITQQHIDDALAVVALGRARTSAIVSERDRSITAWHEAGHTVAALVTEADDPVHVSITPRGPAGGVTWMAGSDDVYLTERKARAQLVVALAGREAEKILLHGDYTTGAHGDLASATRLARAMVTEYGMGVTVGVVPSDTVTMGSDVGARVVQQVEILLQEAQKTARGLMHRYRAQLEALAAALLVDEELSGDRIRAVFDSAAPSVDAPGLRP